MYEICLLLDCQRNFCNPLSPWNIFYTWLATDTIPSYLLATDECLDWFVDFSWLLPTFQMGVLPTKQIRQNHRPQSWNYPALPRKVYRNQSPLKKNYLLGCSGLLHSLKSLRLENVDLNWARVGVEKHCGKRPAGQSLHGSCPKDLGFGRVWA